MQPNTLNTHHNTDPPVPPELLETVARALASVFIPPPRTPDSSSAEGPADFLTTAQLARRLGVSRETVRRLAIAGALPPNRRHSFHDPFHGPEKRRSNYAF